MEVLSKPEKPEPVAEKKRKVTFTYNELPLSGHLSKFSESNNKELGVELDRLFSSGER